MLKCITCRTAISRHLSFVEPVLPFGLNCRFKPSLVVVMNTVGLQALSASDKFESSDIVRIGGGTS
jgi:hypothetical protein